MTIDGGNADRVLVGNNLDLSGLTIAHGVDLTGSGGGCVQAEGDLAPTRARLSNCLEVAATLNASGGGAVVIGNLTMNDSVIAASKASGAQYAVGGGVIVGGTATLFGSSISGNEAQASQMPALGGGLYAHGALSLHASTVDGNLAHSNGAAAYGGGLHAYTGALIAEGSLINGNTASSDASWSYGGGISNGLYSNPAPATVTIKGSTFSNNTVSSLCSGCIIAGGAVHAFDSIVSEYATFNDNHATCDAMSPCSAGGGALSSFGSQAASSHITLRNVTLSANKAVGTSGGLGLGGALMAGTFEQIFVHTTTIAFNYASDLGGGIVASSGPNLPSELVGTIIADNDTAAGASDIDTAPFANGVTFSGSNNLVMIEGGSVALPADTLNANPALQPLTTNQGGATATHPLSAGSVAIDAGANPDWLGCDQRGFPHRRSHGAGPDIGAYEFDGEPRLFADSFDGMTACPSAP